MDLSAYKGKDQGEEGKASPKAAQGAGKPILRPFEFQKPPLRGERKPSYVTKDQVYEILRNSYRTDQGGYGDVGEANRALLQQHRNRQFQAQAIEQQARQRRAQRG